MDCRLLEAKLKSVVFKIDDELQINCETLN